MSFLGSLKRNLANAWRSVEQTTISAPAQWLMDLFGGGSTASGVSVTAQSAMGVSAVYACVKVISEDLASMPLVLFERSGGDARAEAFAHPLHEILGHQPNPEMDAGQFIEMMTGHVLLRGNAYAEVVRDVGPTRNSVTALWPLHPDHVTPRRIEGELVYEVRLPDGRRTKDGSSVVFLDRSRILHLKGLSSDGITGLSPLHLHAEAIGLSIALERHGAALFGNGATPGGVLQSDKPLGDKTYERLKKAFENRHQGLENAHRVAILENGVKWQQVGLQNDHAQFIESRRLQIEEACRIFRMAQIMVSAQEKSTSWGSGIEQMQIGHVQFTIRPWAVRWERAIRAQLLLPAERQRFFARYKLQALMRGDNEARASFYEKMLGMGALSPNGIRALEDENPREGGDVYYRQQTLVPADSPGPAAKKENAQPSRTSGFVALLSEVFSRALRRAEARVPAAAKKPVSEFNRWFTEFAAEERASVGPQLELLGRALVETLEGAEAVDLLEPGLRAWSHEAARRHVNELMDEVRDLVAAAPEARAEKITEAARAWPAGAREAAERELERVIDLVNTKREKAA